MERRRRIAIGLGVVALVAALAPRPNGDIRIDLAEAPRARAAVTLGLMGVSLLVTLSAERLR